jgi:hypothetical protein
MMEQEDFDRIALFVAVASELRREPFLSEDNHDRLTMLDEASGRPFAQFCHPAFLKSAILPFRRLWLDSERCSFEKVCDLVLERHFNQTAVSAYRPFHEALYVRRIDEPADKDWANESTRYILNLWLYTQAIHAGQREKKDGKIINKRDPTLQQFDECAQRIGREKFEYLFRISVRIVGSTYVQFLTEFAEPLFYRLQREGMKPGFEARAALEFNPYHDPLSKISFDDVFWHLDKETMEETFDRLLARESYRIIDGLCRGLFDHRAAALAAICQSDSLAEFFDANRVVLLKERLLSTDRLRCRHELGYISPFGPIAFDVFEDRKVWFEQRTRGIFEKVYCDFRCCLFQERQRQRKRVWRTW